MLEVLEGVHCILPYMLEAVEGARDILIIKKAGGALIVGEIPSQAKPAWLLAKPAWLLDLIKRGLAWLETAWLIASPGGGWRTVIIAPPGLDKILLDSDTVS